MILKWNNKLKLIHTCITFTVSGMPKQFFYTSVWNNMNLYSTTVSIYGKYAHLKILHMNKDVFMVNELYIWDMFVANVSEKLCW